MGFSVAGSGLARERARGLAQWLGGWVLPELETDHARVAYHAAASLLAAAAAGAVRVFARRHGARRRRRDAARRGSIQLLRSVATNLEEVEPRDALTGPSARGDVEVVRAHLEALTPEGRNSIRRCCLRCSTWRSSAAAWKPTAIACWPSWPRRVG
ncbi:MAG: DUF2520 domain-containing protein [Planctomycetota bacterium]